MSEPEQLTEEAWREWTSEAIRARDKEIERLRALLDGDCEHGYFRGQGCGICGPVMARLEQENARLRQRVEELEEALEWYASEDRYVFHKGADLTEAETDEGKRARAALRERGEG
jgi:hypothetical protein